MRIVLSNFRCYASAEFTLPDTGLVLLSGMSGAGKSTLLLAIKYALFGGIRNPCTHGKDKCTVELEYTRAGASAGLHIVRTNKPNRLVLTQQGVRTEGDAAQATINSYLGLTGDVFKVSSHIEQNMETSLLALAPAEQLLFVNTLAMGDTSSSDRLIEIIRDTLRSEELEVSTMQGEHKAIENMIAELSEKVAVPQHPPTKTEDELTVIRSTITRKTSTIENKLATAQASLKEIQAERSSVEQRKQLQAEIVGLQKLLPATSPIDMTDAIETHQHKVTETQQLLYFLNKYETLKSLVNEKRDELTRRLTDLDVLTDEQRTKTERDLAEATSKLREIALAHDIRRQYDESILVATTEFNAIHKEIVSKNKKLAELTTAQGVFQFLCQQLADYEQDQKVLTNATTAYECPSCQCILSFTGDKLVIADETVDDTHKLHLIAVKHNVSQTRTWIERLRVLLPTFASTKPPMPSLDEIDPLETKVAKLNTLLAMSRNNAVIATKCQRELDNLPSLELTRSGFPSTTSLTGSVASMYVVVKGMLAECVPLIANNTQESLRAAIEGPLKQRTVELAKQQEVYDRYCTLTTTIEQLRNKLSALPEVTSTNDPDQLTDAITEYTTELAALRRKHELCSKQFAQIKTYKAYLDTVESLAKLKARSETLTATLATIQTRAAAMHTLVKLIREARLLAVQRTLHSLNIAAAEYLDNLFVDPINVYMTTTKTLKTTKTEKQVMNTRIVYHGAEYDDVKQLSGGEKQRCHLAFVLAANELTRSPLLFLDECLNNLDADTNTTALGELRNYASDKLVLVVSHEAVKGVFDQVIDV